MVELLGETVVATLPRLSQYQNAVAKVKIQQLLLDIKFEGVFSGASSTSIYKHSRLDYRLDTEKKKHFDTINEKEK